MASRYPANALAGRPRSQPPTRPVAAPDDKLLPPEEITPVHDLIRRLEGAVDRGSFGPEGLDDRIAAEKNAKPRRTPHDRTQPLALGVWSPRETKRFLDTLLVLRAVGGSRPAGLEAIAAGVSQWLTDRDQIILKDQGIDFYLAGGGNRDRALRALHANQPLGDTAEGTRIITAETDTPAIKQAAPTALEAVMTAQRIKTPDIVVACLEETTDAHGTLSDAFDLAVRLHLPLLFIGEFSGAPAPGRNSGGSAAERLSVRHELEIGRADATDIIGISEVSGDLIHAIRCGGAPGYLEISVPTDTTDTGPVRRLLDAMIARGDITAKKSAALARTIDAEVADIQRNIIPSGDTGR